MKEIFFVFVGGGTGAALRFMTSMLWQHLSLNPRYANISFPWPTFVVNIVGCFLIGLFYQYSERWGLQPEARLLLTTGFCGGLTTFSTFSNEGIVMLRSGDVMSWIFYTIVSVIAGIVAVAIPFIYDEHIAGRFL